MSDPEAKQVVSANVRRLRGERTYTEIAGLAGTSAGAVRDIELGLRAPGVGLLTRLADAFAVGVDELLKKPSRKRSP